MRHLAALAVVMLVQSAAAQECKPLVMLSTIQMEPSANGTQNFVPFTVNGQLQKMLLDTGGSATQLSERTVTAMSLKTYRAPIVLTGMSGMTSNSYVNVDDIAFGQLHGKNMRMMVSPPGIPYDGLVSGDLLLGYDFDIDFGSHTLNFFAKDHCPGKVLYWKADNVAVAPGVFRGRSHMIIPVEIDGKTVRALIDTGATDSFIRVNNASKFFGLGQESQDPVVKFNDPFLTGYRHAFGALSFGGGAVTVKNPRIVVTWIKQSGMERTMEYREKGEPELTLGMNILRYLHVYAEANAEKLYISAATVAPTPMTVDASAPLTAPNTVSTPGQIFPNHKPVLPQADETADGKDPK